MNSSLTQYHQSTCSPQQDLINQLSRFVRQQPSRQGAQKLADMAENNDLSYASLLISAARNYFGEAFRQWTKYASLIEEPITRFMKHLSAKICHSKMPWLERMFSPLKKQYLNTTHKPIPPIKEQDIRLNGTDIKAAGFASQLMAQSKNKTATQYPTLNQAPIQNNQPQAPPDKLHPEQQFGDGVANSRIQMWRELYFKIKLSNLPFFTLNWSSDTIKDTKEYKAQQEANTTSTNFADCGCCLSFVVEGQNLAFPGSRQMTTFFGRLSRIGQMQNVISQQVVGCLNGRGGVLLVGCSQSEGGQVIGVPQNTWESIKQTIENKVQSWFGTIYPAVTLKRQVDLSFIPIMSKTGQWIKGAYLMRIVVQPTDPQTTYFYTYNQRHYFAAQGFLQPITLKQEDIYRFMKARYKQYNSPNTQTLPLRQKGNNYQALAAHLSPCHLPQKGQPDFGNGVIKSGILDISDNKSNNPLLHNRQNFKNVSLLVASKQVLSFIQQIFRDRQKLEVIVEPAFLEKKFKLSNSTWLVWHSVKFEKLSGGIKKYMNELKQRNQKKPPLLISTCNYLKIIDDPLGKQLVLQIIKTAKQQANEDVEYNSIDDYDFFKCPSPITAVFLYFYLNQQRKKSVFEKPPINNKHKHTRPNHQRSEKQDFQATKFKSPFPEESQIKGDNKMQNWNSSPNQNNSIGRVEQNTGLTEKSQVLQSSYQVQSFVRQLWQGGPIIWCQFMDVESNIWYYCNNYIAYCYDQYGVYLKSMPYNESDLKNAMNYAQHQMHNYIYQPNN